MAKYRKKPTVVEAVQFWAGVEPWPEGVKGARGSSIWIETLEGDMKVSNGDWIITGIKGEKYPCKPDIFEMTYDKVNND